MEFRLERLNLCFMPPSSPLSVGKSSSSRYAKRANSPRKSIGNGESEGKSSVRSISNAGENCVGFDAAAAFLSSDVKKSRLGELSALLSQTLAEGEELKANARSMCVPRTSSERQKAVQNAIDGVNDLITVTGPSLHVVHEGGKKLSQKILTTKKLATKVTGRVRQLNSCRSRAQAALDHVNGILGLKGCVVGVQTSMRNGDLRQAAEYVYKYRNAGDSAEGLTPASDAQLMSATESELREAVLAKLEEAVMGIDEKAEEAVVEYCGALCPPWPGKGGAIALLPVFKQSCLCNVEEELLLANIERASMRRGYMAPHGTNFVDLLSKLYNDSAAAMQRAEAVVLSMPGFERGMPAPFFNLSPAQAVRC